MPITSPTMAEDVLSHIRQTRRPAWRVAEEAGGDVEKFSDRIEYTFDDDSVLITRGRGRNHKMETRLP